MGNTRDDGDDLDDIDVSIIHELDGFDSSLFEIGMHETQAIHCNLKNGTGAVEDASFTLTFFNQEVTVGADTTISDLRELLKGLHVTFSEGMNVSSHAIKVCGRSPNEPVYVTFEKKGNASGVYREGI
jgi:hypothetical protein